MENPSLRARLPVLLQDAYRRARTDALEETGLLSLPETSPFTLEQALGDALPDE